MKHSDTAMGKAMTIAIHICTGGGEHENEENNNMEKSEEAAPKGKRPTDAPKLPEGWHYMPDGKVMSDDEHEGEYE